MAHTKKAMALLILFMTQWWTTTRVYITGDESMRHQVRKLKDGRVEYGLPERLVLMSNHQVLLPFLKTPISFRKCFDILGNELLWSLTASDV